MNSNASDRAGAPTVRNDAVVTAAPQSAGDFDDLVVYLSVLREWWLRIAVATFAAVVTAGLVSKFAMTKWYEAKAVLRPAAQPSMSGRLAGFLGGIGAAAGGMGVGDVAGGSPDAQEYITILTSFAFSVTLAQQHHLDGHLVSGSRDRTAAYATPRTPRWAMYRALTDRFRCEYSPTTGNLSLFYDDTDPAGAERVLGFYISDLRNRLRSQEIKDAAAAINSLESEIKRTSDTLLEQQLYELMAKQIERETLAQVEANFAFTVIDPPVAPDRPTRPKTISNCLMAGLATVLTLSGGIIAWSVISGRPSRGAGWKRPGIDR